MNAPDSTAQPKMSIMAILAFVFAFICGPIGLILGVIALIAVGRSGGRLKGLGFAIAAIPVSIVFAGILAASAIPAFVNYTRKAKTSEARLNVERCVDAVMRYHAQYGAAPPSSQWTPVMSPSAAKYTPDPAVWSASPWREMGFSVMEPHYYQYQVANDGVAVYCRARGDLDGDGIYSLFEQGIALTGGTPEVSPIMLRENETE